MDTQARNRRALIILAITWAAIAVVAANWLISRQREANAKADLQAREAEFMAKMDRIAAEEERRRAGAEPVGTDDPPLDAQSPEKPSENPAP
jgi:hypothetical protein